MKPWFEKEAKIIPFPKKPERQVIKMPSVSEYPDFITGVLDLQARRDKGQISKDSYNRLYQDLIHRFMKKESFENPWFLRELKEDPLQQIKRLIIDKINLETNENILRKLLKYVEGAGVDDKLSAGIRGDQDAKGLPNLVADIMNVPGTQAEKQSFADNMQKGFIDIAKTFSPGLRNSISDIFMNTVPVDPKNKEKMSKTFVHRVFERLMAKDYRPGDSGPGEVALAVLSPVITRTGGTAGTVSDLVVNTKPPLYVEAKGQFTGTPGRLKDEKVSTHSVTEAKRVLEKYGFGGQLVAVAPERGKSLGLAGPNGILEKLAKEGKHKPFIKEMAKAFFFKRGQEYLKGFEKVLASNNPKEIIDYYTRALYDMYLKAKVSGEKKLNGMIFVNKSKQTVFYSQNFDQVQQNGYKLSQLYLTGTDRDMAPALTIQ
jgi:hypothetical protein